MVIIIEPVIKILIDGSFEGESIPSSNRFSTGYISVVYIYIYIYIYIGYILYICSIWYAIPRFTALQVSSRCEAISNLSLNVIEKYGGSRVQRDGKLPS